jgi:hypothetical protein
VARRPFTSQFNKTISTPLGKSNNVFLSNDNFSTVIVAKVSPPNSSNHFVRAGIRAINNHYYGKPFNRAPIITYA